jgi:hypothetical protein
MGIGGGLSFSLFWHLVDFFSYLRIADSLSFVLLPTFFHHS